MRYAWLLWSLFLLVIWMIVYRRLDSPDKKHEMLVVSFWTALLGLIEPLFVPAYWTPPSLFDLAINTGFDIESLLFSFGIGGLAVAVYERCFPSRHQVISLSNRHSSRHRYHLWTILATPLLFMLLLLATDLNPIYSAVIALLLGGLLTWYCRPDLKKKMLTSAVIFLGLYFFYFLTLIVSFPGYVEKVWNLPALSGLLILGIPLEELLFAFSFGFLWSSIYEHWRWRTIKTG